jgi:cardiolipin synthase
MTGEPIPEYELMKANEIPRSGDMRVRVVADAPSTAGMFRLDQLVAALARKRLWLTDAYFAGTTAYVQALRALAMDGVDVRLLVPDATNIPLAASLSRAGYRTLLQAGVRIFEWNGAMLHAKTAVADSNWARVGSTNLNMVSWFGNCELDIVVENESFALKMEQMYLDDLTNATEIVLDAKRRVRPSGVPRRTRRMSTRGGGSGRRATAGVLRIGNAVGSAFTGRRVLDAVEARLVTNIGQLLLIAAVLIILFPRALMYPLAGILIWLGVALIYRGYKLVREARKKTKKQRKE